MADNTILNTNVTSGDVIATEDIAGVKHELIKLEFGADGVATKVSATDPLPVTTDGLTNAELRATPVPVSGTVTVDTSTLATSSKQDTGNSSLSSILAKIITAPATEAKQDTGNTSLASIDGKLTNPLTVTGTVTANTGLTQPLTDAQLRATPVPVSGTVTVDTSLLATSAKQDTGNTSLSSIDTKLTNPLPVSAASLPLPSLAATSTKQSDGTQKSQVVDGSGNVIGATSNALDVNIKSGNPSTITVTQGTGTNLHTVVDSGTITAVTAITNNVNTVEVAPTTILNGKTTVTTAGTRVTLAASTACKSVTIKALAANTGIIYVGNSSVASTNGFALRAGEAISLDIANLNTINLDSSVNSEGVTYLGVN